MFLEMCLCQAHSSFLNRIHFPNSWCPLRPGLNPILKSQTICLASLPRNLLIPSLQGSSLNPSQSDLIGGSLERKPVLVALVLEPCPASARLR